MQGDDDVDDDGNDDNDDDLTMCKVTMMMLTMCKLLAQNVGRLHKLFLLLRHQAFQRLHLDGYWIVMDVIL